MEVAVPKKKRLTKSVRETDGVEDLGAAIGLVGRDAHLGHDLEQALTHRLDVAIDHFVGIDLGREFAFGMEGRERFEGEVGVDGFGAVAGQHGEMVHLAGFAGFDDEAGRGAQALADQVVMHGGRGQQRRNGDAVGGDEAIAEHDDVVFAARRRFRPPRRWR